MPKSPPTTAPNKAAPDLTPHITAMPTRLEENFEIQHARLLGMCIAAWAHAEEALTLLLGTLLGVDHRRAEIVFYASTSEKFRVDLIRQLARHVIPEKWLLLNGCLSLFTSLAGKRNTYVHGLWKV